MSNLDKVKGIKLGVLQRLAENNAEPKPYNPGRPGRLFKRQEVKEVDKPMTFNMKKVKALF